MATNNPKIIITASDQTKAAFDSVNRSLSTLAKNSQKLQTSFKDFAKFSLAGFSVVGFAGFVKGAIDAQDNLKDLSKSTSISIQDLAGLSSAALKSGSDLESIAQSINKLSVNIGKEPEKYRAIGISAKEPIEAFKQLADIFVQIKDPQERAAFAAEALGKSWAGAAPALSEGGKRLGEMIEKGKALSKITEETAEKADELNDQLVDLKSYSSSVATNFANLLVPSLTGTAKAMQELAEKGSPVLALLRGFAGLGKIPFDLAFGSIDNSVKGQIADLEKTLGDLKTKASRAGTGGGGIINEFVFGKKGEFDQQILVVQNQIEALKKYVDSTKKKPTSANDFVGPPVDLAGFINGKKDPKDPKGTKTFKTVKAKDPYTDLLTPAAEDYAKAIEALNNSQLDAEKSTLKLNDAETILYDLMKSTAWKDMPEPWKELVTAQVEAASAAIKTAEKTKELNDLLAATPTAKLEEMRGKMLLLADAFEAGKVTAEQFSEAAQTALGTTSDLAQEATDEMSEFSVQAARNMQDAFAEFLFDPFKDGVDGMLKSFGTMLQKMIANAVAADLAKYLFGKAGGGEGSGLVGAGMDWLSGILPSYDVGTNYVPRDMVAMVHQGEKIIPAAQNKGSGSNVINLYYNGTNSQEMRKSAGAVSREVLSAISGAGRYR